MNVPKLERYEVLGRLATGGMAEVWLARTRGIAGFQKLVVLKTILPSLANVPQFVSMFIAEAQLAAMLTHPNCIQIFDLGQENGWLYIAMEFLEGFSFARVMNRAKQRGQLIEEKVLARIVMDSASGLDHAHRFVDREGRHLALVHRDVSPDNLLIGFSGQVKVVDFGIAKAATPAVLSVGTMVGTVKGKHGYIAPEYLSGLRVDARADLFALGVVLFRALTGKRPFRGNSEAEMSMAVLRDAPINPFELVPDVNPGLAAVALKALEKDPDQRFDSARAMRQALESAVGRPADNEEVAELMNTLWPRDDAERVALDSLAAGTSEESSSPALRVISGTFPSVAVVTPSRFLGRTGAQVATPARGEPPPVEGAPVAEAAPAADGPAEEAPPQAAPIAEAAPAVDAPTEDPPPQAASVAEEEPAVELPTDEPPPEAGAAAEEAPDVGAEAPPPAVRPVYFESPPLAFDAPKRSRLQLVVSLIALVVAAGAVAMLVVSKRTEGESQSSEGAPDAASGKGRVRIAPSPAVKVFSGKKELGTSPLEVDLPAGPVTLRLVNKAAGVDQEHALKVTAGGKLTLRELATGKLLVKAAPWAYVKVDGQKYGETPVTVPKLYEGTHVVELTNTNFNETRRLEVKVKRGETRTVSVDFDADNTVYDEK